jgi:hypothetical protein
MDLKRETISILHKVSNKEISIDEAQRTISVLYGITNSIVCRLDRIPKNCCIYLHISKDCKTCGHYIANK